MELEKIVRTTANVLKVVVPLGVVYAIAKNTDIGDYTRRMFEHRGVGHVLADVAGGLYAFRAGFKWNPSAGIVGFSVMAAPDLVHGLVSKQYANTGMGTQLYANAAVGGVAFATGALLRSILGMPQGTLRNLAGKLNADYGPRPTAPTAPRAPRAPGRRP